MTLFPVRWRSIAGCLLLVVVFGLQPARAIAVNKTAKPRDPAATQRLFRPDSVVRECPLVALYRPSEAKLRQLDQRLNWIALGRDRDMQRIPSHSGLSKLLLKYLGEERTMFVRITDRSGMPTFDLVNSRGKRIKGDPVGWVLEEIQTPQKWNKDSEEPRPIPAAVAAPKWQLVPKRLSDVVDVTNIQVKYDNEKQCHVTHQAIEYHDDIDIHNAEGQGTYFGTQLRRRGSTMSSALDALDIGQLVPFLGPNTYAERVHVSYHTIGGDCARSDGQNLGNIPQVRLEVNSGGLKVRANFLDPDRLDSLSIRSDGVNPRVSAPGEDPWYDASYLPVHRLIPALATAFWERKGERVAVSQQFFNGVFRDKDTIHWHSSRDGSYWFTPDHVSYLTRLVFGIDLLQERFDTKDVLHHALNATYNRKRFTPRSLFGREPTPDRSPVVKIDL